MSIHLIQGDASSLPLADGSVDFIVTSPPYADQRRKTYGGVHPDRYVEWFRPVGAELFRVLKPTGSFVLNIKEKVVDGERHPYVLHLIEALRGQGWRWVEEYIWHKKNCAPGKWPNRFRDAWERCLHFSKAKAFFMDQDAVKKPVADWRETRFGVDGSKLTEFDKSRHNARTRSGFGFRRANMNNDMVLPSNVLHLASECGNAGHSAAFPQPLPEFFVKLFTRTGDVVLDPFAGSGTTGVVADRLGRRAVMVDLIPEFSRVSRQLPTLFGAGGVR